MDAPKKRTGCFSLTGKARIYSGVCCGVTEKSDKPVLTNYFIEPGYIFVAAKPAVISGVLGSCVAVCIYDRKRKVGGMNHYKYPVTTDPNHATALYGNVATLTLLKMMINDGSRNRHLEAQIIGGAYNPEISPENIGAENVRIAKKILIRQRIRVFSEDVGGNRGRKVIFKTDENQIAVMKVDRLRSSDWYPYEETR